MGSEIESMSRDHEETEEVDATEVAKRLRLKLDYKSERRQLFARDIERMKQMENRRPLRDGHVRKLLKVLESGKVFRGVIVINKVKDGRATGGYRWVVIDGNHRWAALIIFFENHPDAMVTTDFHIYTDLTEEQEREVFKEYSIVVSMRQSDILFVHQKDIPVYGLMQGNFPAPVRIIRSGIQAGKGSFNFTSLVKAYMGRYQPHHLSPQTNEILDAVKKLDVTDYKRIKEFAEDFVEVFAYPTSENPYAKMGALSAIVKVYFCNVGRLGRADVVSRLKSRVYGDAETRQKSVDAARSVMHVKELTELMVSVANRQRKDPNRMFLTPAELQESMKKTGE